MYTCMYTNVRAHPVWSCACVFYVACYVYLYIYTYILYVYNMFLAHRYLCVLYAYIHTYVYACIYIYTCIIQVISACVCVCLPECVFIYTCMDPVPSKLPCQEPWWNLCVRMFNGLEAPDDPTDVEHYAKVAEGAVGQFMKMVEDSP